MTEIEEVRDVEEITDQAELKQLLDQTQSRIENARQVKEDLQKHLDDMKHQLYQAQRDLDACQNELSQDVYNVRLIEKRQGALTRQQEAEEKQRKLAEEFQTASDELDRLTKDAFWRKEIFDFQVEGGKRLAVAKRAILGDKRGLGKTRTSLVYMDMVQAKKVLIIAINDVAPEFAEEIRKWSNGARTIVPLYGLPPVQRAIIYPFLKTQDEFCAIINYEAWRRDKSVVDDILRLGIDTLIIDEAHKMKEWDKLTARGISQIVFRPNLCTVCQTVEVHVGDWSKNNLIDYKPEDEHSQRIYQAFVCAACGAPVADLSNTIQNVLPMTGTPILNKPQEMFSLLHICYPHLFPTESAFLYDHCMRLGNNNWKFSAGGEAKLADKIKGFFVQRTREDTGSEVPPPKITLHELEKDRATYGKQYEAERELIKASRLIIDEMSEESFDFFYMLEVILRQRQMMTWPVNMRLNIKDPETKEIIDTIIFSLPQSQKLDAVTDLLKDLIEEDERVIVFSQFKEPLYELQARLGSDIAVVATGDQPSSLRKEVIADFDLKTATDTPKWKVCLGTYKAFSVGLNLNAARHMILLDDEWNPGSQDQAIGRIDRINSKDQANVHIFRVKGSVDDFMSDLIESKREMISGAEAAVSAADMFKAFKEFLAGE